MPLCFVMHDLPPAGVEALQAALWEVAESHWNPTPGCFAVATGLSVGYLGSHLAGAMRRAGAEGPMLVVEAGGAVSTRNLSEAGASWLRERIEEYSEPASA